MTMSNPIQILLNKKSENQKMVNIDIIKSPMKYEILKLLRENEMNFEEIVKNTTKSKATVSLHLKGLREEGIIKDKADPNDNRKKIFYLNSKMLGSIDSRNIGSNKTKNLINNFIKDGNIEYWICTVCGAKFSDEAAISEIKDVLIPAEHTGDTEIRDAVAATETAEGYTGDTYCLACGEKIAEGTTIPKLDHSHEMSKVERKEATCTEDGNIEYWTCTKCGKNYSEEAAENELSVLPETHFLPALRNKKRINCPDGFLAGNSDNADCGNGRPCRYGSNRITHQDPSIRKKLPCEDSFSFSLFCVLFLLFLTVVIVRDIIAQCQEAV